MSSEDKFNFHLKVFQSNVSLVVRETTLLHIDNTNLQFKTSKVESKQNLFSSNVNNVLHHWPPKVKYWQRLLICYFGPWFTRRSPIIAQHHFAPPPFLAEPPLSVVYPLSIFPQTPWNFFARSALSYHYH